jgi:predicted ATPase
MESFRYTKAVNTNWYVITGGPFAGKTTLIRALEKLGYEVEEESARAYIDEELQKGKTIEVIRGDEALFQQAIFDRKIERHSSLPQDKTIFFDRGLPDSIAYLRANDLKVTSEVETATKHSAYKKVFILDLVGHSIDHARTESKELASRIHTELARAYEELGIPVVRVPVLPVSERVQFVLNNL